MAPDAHSAELWDTVAAGYDSQRPDQGLTDPSIRAAWLALLEHHLPPGQGAILDVGCGTGSLSLLLADQGHLVTGIDFSPAMIAVTQGKAADAGIEADFIVGDATTPDIPEASLDAIICRQTLWALPDRHAALANWARLLREGGVLILVEGRFASGRGMSEAELADAWPATLTPFEVTDLSQQAALWGGPLTDQRLLFVAARPHTF